MVRSGGYSLGDLVDFNSNFEHVEVKQGWKEREGWKDGTRGWKGEVMTVHHSPAMVHYSLAEHLKYGFRF